MVQVSAGLQPRGGKVPPVLGEKISTMSLNICPATAARILPHLRQVCSFHGVPKDSILMHVVDPSLSATDTAGHQFRKEFCACAPPSSPLISVRSLIPLPSHAHVRELLQQPSPEMLYTGKFHRTRSDQVLGESSFANPFKLRHRSKIEECSCSYRNHLRCRSDFPLRFGAWSGPRLVCHCELEDRCHADVLVAEFAHFFGATWSPFTAVRATLWSPHAFLEAARLLPHPFQDVALEDNILQLCFDYVTKGQIFPWRSAHSAYWRSPRKLAAWRSCSGGPHVGLEVGVSAVGFGLSRAFRGDLRLQSRSKDARAFSSRGSFRSGGGESERHWFFRSIFLSPRRPRWFGWVRRWQVNFRQHGHPYFQLKEGDRRGLGARFHWAARCSWASRQLPLRQIKPLLSGGCWSVTMVG